MLINERESRREYLLNAAKQIMTAAGLAAQELNWLKGCKCVFAIPVSASSKNPFFDRVVH